MKKIIGILMLLFCVLNGFAQTTKTSATAKVYFLRLSSISGILVPFTVNDGSRKLCTIYDNQYVIRGVTAGNHEFFVDDGNKHISKKNKFTTEAGKTYYFLIRMVQGSYNGVTIDQTNEIYAKAKMGPMKESTGIVKK